MIELKNHILLSFLDKSTAERLLQKASVESFQQNHLIFAENSKTTDIYLVLNGSVKITKKDPSGKDQPLAMINENDYFGEFAALDGLPRSATATAVEPETVLARIAGEDVLKIFKGSNQHVELQFALHIIRKVRENNQKTVEELLRKERMTLLGEMASAVIHDLKTPSSAVLLATGMITDEGVTESQKECCEMIERQTLRMTTMVNEILDFAKGAPSLKKKNIDIRDIFNHLDKLNRVTLNKSGIDLKINCPSIPVFLDEVKILRVVQNIVGNAADALAQGGNITINCAQQKDNLIITIADNGPGIPQEMVACLFEPFKTFGKGKGTGLGMAITKSIIEAHQGSIHFTTSSEQGTTFTIQLPLNNS